MPLVSQAEYARSRGVSKSVVTRFKQRGYLDGAFVEKDGKAFLDSEKADELLAERLDPSRGGKRDSEEKESLPEDRSFLEARTWSERYRAADRKLTYEIRAGKYVLKSEVREHNFKIARICRDALLNMSSRIAPIIAGESDQAKICQMIDSEVQTILKELVLALGAI
jgi:hypothetical protein